MKDKHGWNKVELNNLPEYDKKVLVFTSWKRSMAEVATTNIEIALLESVETRHNTFTANWRMPDYSPIGSVTHWQELPNEPIITTL